MVEKKKRRGKVRYNLSLAVKRREKKKNKGGDKVSITERAGEGAESE